MQPVPRGAGGGRRLAGGDQPARQRHRQHGLRRSGGLPGDTGGRYRPRRRLRPSGGHPGAALGKRAGAGQRLRDQPFSWRYRPAQTRPRLAGAAYRQAGSGRPALSHRLPPGSRGRHRPAPGGQGRRGVAGGGAGAAAHQQPHRLRSAAPASPGTARLRCPRPAHPTGGPGHPPRLQERARRPRPPARAWLGPGPAAPPALRRQGARHLRRLPDARPQRQRPPWPGRHGGGECRPRLAGHRHPAGAGEAAA
ncbi:hypothetical protein D3C76_1023030 [compost metagenome]